MSGNLIYFILSLSTAQRLTQILRVECEGGEIFEQSKFQILNLSAPGLPTPIDARVIRLLATRVEMEHWLCSLLRDCIHTRDFARKQKHLHGNQRISGIYK